MRPVSHWIADLAADAIRVQSMLDRAGAGMLIARHTVSAAMVMEARRTRGFEINAAPFNLNYAIRFGAREDSHSRVTVEVVAHPVQEEAADGPAR
ncbi:MAG: hypothetical protein SFV18_04815 [Bryobacteraceae bacterium]|nr:hypothetical protein [Bryobacteraceae bacterium]